MNDAEYEALSPKEQLKAVNAYLKRQREHQRAQMRRLKEFFTFVRKNPTALASIEVNDLVLRPGESGRTVLTVEVDSDRWETRDRLPTPRKRG